MQRLFADGDAQQQYYQEVVMKHHDENGKMSPAMSKVAKAMRNNGNGHKAKKIAKIEKVRATEPKHTEEGWKDVEKSGGYRKAFARGMKKTHKAWKEARGGK